MYERWFSPRALLLHLAVLIVVPGCLIAGWWQVNVALSGNALSYLYAVEWPVFAVIAVFLWWQLIHDSPEKAAARKRAQGLEAGDDRGADLETPTARAPERKAVLRRFDQEDEELSAYNDYLARLAVSGGRKTFRHPRGDPSIRNPRGEGR